jgi:phage tail-like protein
MTEILEELGNPLTGEQYNITEDGTTEKGQLERFFKIPGIELDSIEGLVDALPVLIDVDKTDADYLPLIAKLVGVEFNFDIPIPQQREEIKRAVEVYKTKGTVYGVARQGRSITGLTVEVDEWANNILMANKPSRKSSVITDKLIADKTGLPGDENQYSVDFREDTGDYSFERFGIYFRIAPGKPVLRSIVEKLERVLPDYRPASTLDRRIFLDLIYQEVMALEVATTEAQRTEHENQLDEGQTWGTDWMTSNAASKISNSPEWVSAYFMAKLERWYDETQA